MDGGGARTAVRSTCAYCGVGCGLSATVRDAGARLVAIAGDPAHPANGGRLCSKGTALNETLGTAGRLLHPRIGGRDVFWGEALDAVAAKIAQVRRDHGPDAIAFYVSGQLLTEDYYVANKLVKGFLGTANIDTNSRLCMASTVVAQQRAFGEDAVPGCYEDLELADLVVLVGSNTAWCHPVLFQRIQAAKAQRGTKVVVIDPRRTATCSIADLHLAIRPGTDAALFNGLLVHLAAQGALDAAFIAQHTAGYHGAFNAAAAAEAVNPNELAACCDVPVDDLRRFFDWFARTPKTVTSWSQGVNQSSGGTDKVSAILNCHLATGRIGKPGATALSLTGQPNAMGGREVGGLATQLAAHLAIDDVAARSRVARFWQTPSLPVRRGLKAVELFEAVAQGAVKFLWIIGTNPAASLPDAQRVRAAIAACEFVVVSDCMADSDTVRLAQVALPAQAWGEKDGTVTNSERRISRQRALLPAAGEAKPDWWALAQVAARLGHAHQFAWRAPAQVFREHAALSAVASQGRRLFDIGALATITDDEYDVLQPAQWPVRQRRPSGEANDGEANDGEANDGEANDGEANDGEANDSARLFADGQFLHADGRARFVAIAPHQPAHAPHDAAPLVLNTARLRDQWHTMTRTGAVPRLTRHTDEPLLEIHPDDAAARGLVDGALCTVTSAQGSARLRARVGSTVRVGEVCAAMHWTRTQAPQSCANVLVNAAVDPQSGQPEFKHTPVAVALFPVQVEAVLLVRTLAALPAADYVVRVEDAGHTCIRLAQQTSASANSNTPARWLQEQLAVALGNTESVQWLLREDCAGGRVAVAALVDGRLAGFAAACSGGAFAGLPTESSAVPVAVSTGQRPARTEWLGRLVARGDLSAEERLWLLTELLPPGEQDGGRQVCACLQVRERTLDEAVHGGCRTLDALVEKTRAGSRCGTCLPELSAFLESRTAAGLSRPASATPAAAPRPVRLRC